MGDYGQWGTLIFIMFLVWSTDIVDWVADKIEEWFKKK